MKLDDLSGEKFTESAMEFAMLDDDAKVAFSARHAELWPMNKWTEPVFLYWTNPVLSLFWIKLCFKMWFLIRIVFVDLYFWILTTFLF